jgi:site-specific recombinase XerD
LHQISASLPLAQELRTYLGNRSGGYLFETNRHLPYSPRRLQQIVKATAEQAKIKKRVYPHLLRHSVATTLLEALRKLIWAAAMIKGRRKAEKP